MPMRMVVVAELEPPSLLEGETVLDLLARCHS